MESNLNCTAEKTRGASGLAIWAAVLALCVWPPHASAAATPLIEALERTGRTVEQFWGHFPEVTCQESVLQTKLEKSGKIIYQQETQFDYLVMAETSSEDLAVAESRQVKRQTGKEKDLPLLVTNGFSMMMLVFHPFYQGSFEFSPPVHDVIDGKPALRIDFQHIKGKRSPSVLQLRGRNYPLDWKGTAWIDPGNWSIRRIEAGLEEPMDDVGLRTLHCDVQYAPVHFSSTPETYWLPQVAEIEAETLRQHWRNVHRFTDYRRFSTDVTEKQKDQP
jgi:hypothetical protein